MKNLYVRLALILFGVLLYIPVAHAQDFQHSYKITAGGSVSIKSVSGDIKITGYDGDAVVVNGFKEGRDRDKVEIVDESGGNDVDVSVRYPSQCNCDASVRFEVSVPRSLNIQIRKVATASGDISVTGVHGDVHVATASGDVEIRNVAGTINASTASGDVTVKEISGRVNAQTASGNVDVDISQLSGAESMRFASASGDVNVRLPGNADADVNMSTATGSIRTDFPIEIKEREYGPGSQARGRLGSGAQRISISTASGDVSLMKN